MTTPLQRSERYAEEIVSHEIGLNMAISHAVYEILGVLDEIEPRLAQEILRLLSKGYSASSAIAARDAHRQAFEKAKAAMGEAQRDIAIWEAGFHRRMLNRAAEAGAFNTPGVDVIEKGLDALRIDDKTAGRLITEAEIASWRRIRQELGDLREIETLFETLAQGAQGPNVERVIQRARTLLEVDLRTILNASAGAGRDAFFRGNPGMGNRVKIVAVLDGRTSEICQRMNGRVYPIDEGPRPPFHRNCRSSWVLIPKGVPEPDLPDVTEWFFRQSQEQQDASLGKARAQWLRDNPDKTVAHAWRRYTSTEPGIPVREIRFQQILRTQGVP